MKIAIFQNFLDTIGGAEVIGLTLARELNADLYTTNVDPEKIARMGFSDVKVYSIGKIPRNAPLRQQMILWRFRRLKLQDKYDFFIISGDWAVSSAINNKPTLWYVHSTIREIWDLFDYTRKNFVPFWQRPIFDVWAIYNRYLNRKYVSQVNEIATNSKFTKERVLNIFGRESNLIYPAIQTNKLRNDGDKGYWLSVNRIIKYKRVEIQMEAFAKMPDKKLIILGPYEKSKVSESYVNFIKKIKPENVTLITEADSFEDLANYYAGCRGFITTCHKEDFGMTAIEAMASGKPVIAPNEGGYKESIIDGENGILIDDIDSDKLVDAVQTIENNLRENPDKYIKACQDRAKKFDISVFIDKIKLQINSYLEKHKEGGKN